MLRSLLDQEYPGEILTTLTDDELNRNDDMGKIYQDDFSGIESCVTHVILSSR